MHLSCIIAVSVAVTLCSAIPAPEVFNCRRPCTREYFPVCGSDNMTYPNDCEFKNGRCRLPELRAMRRGRCDDSNKRDHGPSVEYLNEGLEPLPCEVACPRVFQPVCASNGQTFSSHCDLENHNCRYPEDLLTAVSSGTCGAPAGAPGAPAGAPGAPAGAPRAPAGSSVFDSYERTRQRATSGRQSGTGGGFVACFRPCPRNFRPICASNDVTYANRCIYDVANCRQSGTLSVKREGRCIGGKRIEVDPRNV